MSSDTTIIDPPQDRRAESDRRDEEDRRAREDRRNSRERRRGGEGRRVALHLGREQLHMALSVTDQQGEANLLLTRSLPWREGVRAKLPHADALTALAATLKQLVASERLSGCEASLVLNGDVCVTRVTTGSSHEVSRSIDEIDDRSQMYLSLGAGEKSFANCRTLVDARHERAMVSVAQKETMQRLVDLFDSAGLDLRVVEAEAAALARAHGVLHPQDEGPVAIVQFDGDAFEVVLANQGQLLLDYRPAGGSEGAVAVLQKHHTRLQRYCQQRTGDYGANLNRVYLAGDADQVAAARRTLGEHADYEVFPLNVDASAALWSRTPNPISTEHAVGLGRVFCDAEVGGEAALTPAPNLMDRWIAESRKHIRPILIRSGAPLILTLVIAAVLWTVNWRAGARVAALDTQLESLSAERIEHDELRLQLLAADAKLAQLERLAADTPPLRLVHAVSSIGGCMPEDVWLDRLTVHDLAKARLTGASYSESGVYDFVRHLNLAPTLGDVALEGTGIGRSDVGPATSFSLNLKLLAPPASPEDSQ